MENKKEIVDEVLKAVLKPGSVYRPDDELVTDLGLDSLKLMEIMGNIEDKLDIIIPINKVAHIKTVRDLYDSIEKLDETVFSAKTQGEYYTGIDRRRDEDRRSGFDRRLKSNRQE